MGSNLSQKKVAELKLLCKSMHLSGYSKLRKADLVHLLNRASKEKQEKAVISNHLSIPGLIGNDLISVERTDDWFVNMTQLSKLFNKDFRNWRRNNGKKIKEFNILEGRECLRTTSGPHPQTFAHIKIVLAALTSYDTRVFHHILTVYMED